MDEIFLQALARRAEQDETFIDKLPADIKAQVQDVMAEQLT